MVDKFGYPTAERCSKFKVGQTLKFGKLGLEAFDGYHKGFPELAQFEVLQCGVPDDNLPIGRFRYLKLKRTDIKTPQTALWSPAFFE